MNQRRLQSALRQMRQHFTDPRVLGGLAIVAVLMGLAGPFGTYAALTTPQRLAYWAAIVVTTYGTGFVFGVIVGQAIWARLPHPALRVLVIGVMTGVPVTLAVVAINLITFGSDAWRVIDFAALWLNVTLISIGVLAISSILEHSLAARTVSPPDVPPPLLDRLPVQQRGALVSLSVADHYVEVTTVKSRALVLLRLSDAIKEASPTRGLQIHRSHWVALDAVAGTLRSDGKLLVELKDGRRLPVSRSYAAAVRAAGLIA